MLSALLAIVSAFAGSAGSGSVIGLILSVVVPMLTKNHRLREAKRLVKEDGGSGDQTLEAANFTGVSSEGAAGGTGTFMATQ